MNQPPLESPPDRLIDAERSQRLPASWRAEYLKRPVEKLPRDVVNLYDLVWKQKRENDLKASALLALQREIDHSKSNLYKNWAVTVAHIIGTAIALYKLFSR